MRLWAIALSFVLAGCALVHESGVETDGGPTPDAPGSPHRRTYVIGRIEAEPADERHAFGFDLDGMRDGAPGTCTDQPDFISPITGASGVDDVFGTFVPTLDGLVGGDGVDGGYRERIQSGELLLVVEISGIDDDVNDASVFVHVVAARPRAPAPSSVCPTHFTLRDCVDDAAGACSWSGVTSACSGIDAGQHFVTRADLGTTTGSIAGGRLTATASVLPLDLFVMSSTLPVTVHDVRIGGRLSPEAITDGEIGGTIRVAELMQGFAALGFSVDIRAFFTPDLLPSAHGITCDGISVGVGFAAVSATLE